MPEGQLACVPDNREGYHSLASSLAKLMRTLTRKSIPNRSRELPGAAPEHPKSTQNRSRDPLGTPRGAQEHSEGIPGASWKRLGAPPARPGIARRVAMSGPGRQEERPGTPGNAPESPKWTPSRTRERKTRCFRSRTVVAAIFLRFLSSFGFFVKSAKSPKYRACQQIQGFGHSHYESCRSRNVASKNNGNRSQNRPEIVGNRVSGPPGRPCRSTFAARSASIERLAATKSVEVGRLGPSGRARYFAPGIVLIRQFE